MTDLAGKAAAQTSSWEPSAEDRALGDLFTDADYALKAFEELVTGDPLAKRLMVVHGPSGIGKSTVLRMCRRDCRRRGIPVAFLEPRTAIGAQDLLREWAIALRDQGLKLDDYFKSLDWCLATQNKVEEKDKVLHEVAVEGAGKVLEYTVPVLVGAAAAALAGMGLPLAPVIGAGAGAAAVLLATVALDRRGKRLGERQRDLLLDETKRFTQDFVAGLAAAKGHERIVLILDNYEHLTARGEWLGRLARELPENVRLILAHYEEPVWDRDWPDWRARTESVKLGEMVPDDVQTLVGRYHEYHTGGAADPEQAEAIARLADGLPLIAFLLADHWVRQGSMDFGEMRQGDLEDIVRRLLDGIPGERRRKLRAASILRVLRGDALYSVLGEGDVDTLHAGLPQWEFIQRGDEGWFMQKAVRDLIRGWVKRTAPEEFQLWHERAAGYYRARRKGTRDGAWIESTAEYLYHSLHADESEGVALLVRLFLEAERLWKLELQERLLGEAEQFHFQDPGHRYWLPYLRARMSRTWSEKEDQYLSLLENDLDDPMRVRVLRVLVEALSFHCRPERTRDYLQQALEICQRIGDPIETAWTRLDLSWRAEDLEGFRELVTLAREAFREAGDRYGEAVAELEMGYYHLNCWQAPEARAAFGRSRILHQQLGNRRDAAMARERIGQAYLIEGDFLQAIAEKEEALKIFEILGDEWAIAWTLDELATCYSWTGQWELGLASDERARDAFSTWGDHREIACIVRQGDFYRKQGRLALAQRTYQGALAREMEHNAWASQGAYAGLAYIHLARGEGDAALAQFQRASAVFELKGMDFEAALVGNTYLGDYHLACDQPSEALDCYSRGVEVARSRHNRAHECYCLAGMCRALYARGRLGRIEVLSNQAEELGLAYGYSQLLADLYLLRGHLALDNAAANEAPQDAVVGFYGTALKHALGFNRYKLDETVQEIAVHCQAKDEQARQVLMALLDLWQTGTGDEGTSLLEAEATAREREPGDGAPQVGVVERIEQA